jgi:hypothetical protein
VSQETGGDSVQLADVHDGAQEALERLAMTRGAAGPVIDGIHTPVDSPAGSYATYNPVLAPLLVKLVEGS